MKPARPTAKNLKLMEKAMTETELPATKPVVVESAAQRLAWHRGIQDAKDEIIMIGEQKASAGRVRDAVHAEAETVYAGRVETAERAMNREKADSDRILEASISSLDDRERDLGKLIAGLEAAMAATAE